MSTKIAADLGCAHLPDAERDLQVRRFLAQWDIAVGRRCLAALSPADARFLAERALAPDARVIQRWLATHLPHHHRIVDEEYDAAMDRYTSRR